MHLRSLLPQILTCYRKTALRSINKRRRGSFLVLFAALFIVVFEQVYHFMTIPHELGHYYAAALVGRKVDVFQADFLDNVAALAVTTGLSSDSASTSGGTYRKDGKLGFVQYRPHIELRNVTYFDSVAEFNTWAATKSDGGVVLPPLTTNGAGTTRIRIDNNDYAEVQVRRLHPTHAAVLPCTWPWLSDESARVPDAPGCHAYAC